MTSICVSYSPGHSEKLQLLLQYCWFYYIMALMLKIEEKTEKEKK
jgi:hypothetical protein